MKLAWVLIGLVLLLDGCAVRYKSGASCWSFEMVSTEDWCEKQREHGKTQHITAEELWADQIRKNGMQP